MNVKLLISIAAILLVSPAVAQEKYNFSALPAFCKARIEPASQAQYRSGEAQFGKGNWDHLHHYCYAAHWWGKYRVGKNVQEKRYALNNVRTNLEYLVTHTRKDFYLRPKIYVELADAYKLMGQTGESAKYLEMAIAFNPTYAAAHAALVGLYREQGASAAALEAATRGLKYAPSSKSLQQSYLALGGRKPFPEPVASPGNDGDTTRGAAPESPTERQDGEQAQKIDEGSPSVKTGEVPEEPLSGCRFCPPEEIQKRWRESFQGEE